MRQSERYAHSLKAARELVRLAETVIRGYQFRIVKVTQIEEVVAYA
jgi:hypothetical protein